MNKLPENISQENPLVCYIVVNQSLGMGVGKLAAQVGHGIQLLMIRYMELLYKSPIELNKNEEFVLKRIRTWLNQDIIGGFRKVVLGVDAKEWGKLKLDQPEHILVTDAGLTEIPSGSETVIVLYPMLKEERSKLLKRLRCL